MYIGNSLETSDIKFITLNDNRCLNMCNLQTGLSCHKADYALDAQQNWVWVVGLKSG